MGEKCNDSFAFYHTHGESLGCKEDNSDAQGARIYSTKDHAEDSRSCSFGISKKAQEEFEKRRNSYHYPGEKSESFSFDKNGRLAHHFLLLYDKSVYELKNIENMCRLEDKDMSLCLALKCNDRIVMASDSRSTRDNHSFIDCFKKMTWLEKSQIAFEFAGVNIIDNHPITDFVKELDGSLSSSPEDAISELAQILSGKIPSGRFINVCCASFGKEPIAWYGDIKPDGVANLKVLDLIYGNNLGIVEKLYVDNTGVSIPNIRLFSERQAVDFLSHIIKTHIKYNEFMALPNVIGGDIQILSLEKGNKCSQYLIYNS